MRALVVLALLPALCAAQAQHDWLGLAPAQVEQLGRAKFMDEFSTKHGSSTAAMCDAEVSYGAALRSLNDDWVARRAPKHAGIVTNLRPLTERYYVLTTDLGFAFSGGGTMWNPVYAGIPADVEEVSGQILGRTKLGPGADQAEIWKTLASAQGIVDDTAKEMDEPFLPDRRPSEDARKAILGIRSLFFQLVQETKGLSKAERRAVYGALYSDLKSSLEMAGVGC